MVGRNVGNYRIEEQIGKGGMGVVYRAVDSKLGRSVAIKVLPDECARDPERRARFEREARLLAALNHPHIAAIHGLEEFDGVCGLVLEYVPGDTVERRLAARPVPRKETLEICRQVADALEAAHARGIVHRDLKPANIKITPDSTVKVLDFGLAKAYEQAPAGPGAGEAATVSIVTGDQMIVGTPAYMSPEQAQGKPLDRRTDIWAFGCLLYELLTRRRAFGGETVSDQLASVLARDPDWKALPQDLDPRVSLLVRRCLEKDPRRRLCDIGDARLELEDLLAGAPGAPPAPPVRRKIFWPAIGAAFLLGAAAAGLGAWVKARRAPPPQVARFEAPLPAGQRIIPSWNSGVMFTPDGSSFGYYARLTSGFSSFLRRFDSVEIKPVAGMPGNRPVYNFSPDGKWAAFVDGPPLILKKVSLGGGPATVLTEVDMIGIGDWGSSGYLYFTYGYPGGIYRVSENGGPKEAVTTLDAQKQELVHKHARILPGGKAILFTVVTTATESYDDASIEVLTLDGKKRKALVQGGFCARFSPSGHIVYARGGSLYAAPFDLGSLAVTGPSVKVADGVFMSTNTGAAYFDISSTGALVYASGVAEGGERSLVWVNRQGQAEPLPLPSRSYLFPRISPDQKTLAVEVEGAIHNLYTYDFARGVMTKLTTDGMSHAPVWTPEGKNLCFRSWRAGTMTMWRMPADRSAPESRLTHVGARQSVDSVSPDGRNILFNQMNPGAGADVYVLPLDQPDKPRPVFNSKSGEASAKFSPDGKWVVYCSDESGKPEAYVQPWPGPGPKIQLSSDGGFDPLWSRKGDEIFYRNGDKMMVVPLSLAGGFQPGRPRLLWESHYSPGLSSSCGMPGVASGNYDVTADGQRFLMVKDNDQDVASTKLVVVLNWARELK